MWCVRVCVVGGWVALGGGGGMQALARAWNRSHADPRTFGEPLDAQKGPSTAAGAHGESNGTPAAQRPKHGMAAGAPQGKAHKNTRPKGAYKTNKMSVDASNEEDGVGGGGL